MTIIHHAGKGGVRPKMSAQDAYTRRQYANKHFPRAYRMAYLTAIAARHLIRAVAATAQHDEARIAAARLALRTLTGREAPPFGPPPSTAVGRTS
jgi:hypothetical protein